VSNAAAQSRTILMFAFSPSVVFAAAGLAGNAAMANAPQIPDEKNERRSKLFIVCPPKIVLREFRQPGPKAL
jgi:hypothetical protein